MLGVFAVPGDNNDIHFVSFDSVIENKSNAVDWSGRVLINDYGDAARNISYQLNDFTQKTGSAIRKMIMLLRIMIRL